MRARWEPTRSSLPAPGQDVDQLPDLEIATEHRVALRQGFSGQAEHAAGHGRGGGHRAQCAPTGKKAGLGAGLAVGAVPPSMAAR